MHSTYMISGLVENEYVFGYFLICHFVSTQTWHTELLIDHTLTHSYFPSPLSLSLPSISCFFGLGKSWLWLACRGKSHGARAKEQW